MYHIMPPRHYIRNLIIFAIAVCLPVFLVIGLVAQLSIRDLFIIALMTFGIGTVVAGLVGWLFLRFVYPQLGTNDDKPSVNTNIQVSPAEKIYADYELNNDDMLSYYSYNYEQSPTLGRARKLIRRALLLAIAVELLVAVVLLVVLGRSYLPFAVALAAFAVLAILYYLLSPLLIRKSLRGVVARDYGHGRDKLTGKHKLSISPDAVTDITDMGESTTRWNAIEWIASTDQYLFMAVRGSGPYIVPRRAFANEEAFRQSVDTAKAYHQAAVRS